MQTCCPKCATVYKVTENQLNMAESKVRCANCQHVFDGRQHLLDQAKLLNNSNSQTTSKAQNELSIHEFKRRIKGVQLSNRAFYLWLSLALISITLLTAQLIWINRAYLANHAITGDKVKQLCGKLHFCKIPQKRDIAAFVLSSRQIYSHPNDTNALILSASFTNAASFAQPYPRLLVSMSDKQGQVVAERYFQPDEYLSTTDDSKKLNLLNTNGQLLMQTNTTTNISLALSDPGKDALAFEIDFF